MEGNRGSRPANSDIGDLQNSEIQLKYLTIDARRVVDELGLKGLTIYYQVLLMEYCYNHDPAGILRKLTRIRDDNPGVNGNTVMTHFLREASFRTGKATHNASFNMNGMLNLLTLDRELAVADYSVNLRELSKELNQISPNALGEWLGTIQEDGLSMPIALYKLQEYLSMMTQRDKEFKERALIDVPKYPPIDDVSRAILEKASEELKRTQEIMEKEDERWT